MDDSDESELKEIVDLYVEEVVAQGRDISARDIEMELKEIITNQYIKEKEAMVDSLIKEGEALINK